jgi:hypothetical protein
MHGACNDMLMADHSVWQCLAYFKIGCPGESVHLAIGFALDELVTVVEFFKFDCLFGLL